MTPRSGFYRELRPIDGLPWEASAEAVHGLSREHLAGRGPGSHGRDDRVRRLARPGRAGRAPRPSSSASTRRSTGCSWPTTSIASWAATHSGCPRWTSSRCTWGATPCTSGRQTTKRHVLAVHPGVTCPHTQRARRRADAGPAGRRAPPSPRLRLRERHPQHVEAAVHVVRSRPVTARDRSLAR